MAVQKMSVAQRVQDQVRSIWCWLVAVRRRWIAMVVGLGVVVGLVVWVAWPAPKQDSAPRARQYVDFSACLLTDVRGLTDERAGAVWAGMQDVSLNAGIKVRYLSVRPVVVRSGREVLSGGGVGEARPMMLGLLGQRCNVVLAAGEQPVAAATEVAADYPAVRFVTLDGPTTRTNVTAIAWSGVDVVRRQVADAVAAAFRSR